MGAEIGIQDEGSDKATAATGASRNKRRKSMLERMEVIVKDQRRWAD